MWHCGLRVSFYRKDHASNRLQKHETFLSQAIVNKLVTQSVPYMKQSDTAHSIVKAKQAKHM